MPQRGDGDRGWPPGGHGAGDILLLFLFIFFFSFFLFFLPKMHPTVTDRRDGPSAAG
jgi:hypothetical protein